MPRDAISRGVIDAGWVEAHEAERKRLTRTEVLEKSGIDEGDM